MGRGRSSGARFVTGTDRLVKQTDVGAEIHNRKLCEFQYILFYTVYYSSSHILSVMDGIMVDQFHGRVS